MAISREKWEVQMLSIWQVSHILEGYSLPPTKLARFFKTRILPESIRVPILRVWVRAFGLPKSVSAWIMLPDAPHLRRDKSAPWTPNPSHSYARQALLHRLNLGKLSPHTIEPRTMNLSNLRKKKRVIPRNCVPGGDYVWPNRSDRPQGQTGATEQAKPIDLGAARTRPANTQRLTIIHNRSRMPTKFTICYKQLPITLKTHWWTWPISKKRRLHHREANKDPISRTEGWGFVFRRILCCYFCFSLWALL